MQRRELSWGSVHGGRGAEPRGIGRGSFASGALLLGLLLVATGCCIGCDNIADWPTDPSAAVRPYCGIAVDVYACRAEVARLEQIDPVVGKSFERMCMGYGGSHPPADQGKVEEDKDTCTLNIHNDCDHWYQDPSGAWRCAPDYGLSKNPDQCGGHYFFLWDEPMTQGLSAEWAADQWKRHVDRWSAEVASLRARGTRVVSPLFSDLGGASRDKIRRFFDQCGEGCSDPTSKYYVDVIGTNQWLMNPESAHEDQEEWIKNEVLEIGRASGGRPVILGNFAWLGASSADQAAEGIARSRIWDRSWSGLEAVFYFAATDYGGGTSNHFLGSATSSGSTVAAALVERCRTYNGRRLESASAPRALRVATWLPGWQLSKLPHSVFGG